jgi:hypothetical protein
MKRLPNISQLERISTMPIISFEKLLEEIEAHPETLRKALERKLKAESLVARLAQEFADEKERLAQSHEEDTGSPDERAGRFKLDLEVNKLQLRYEQKRGQLEMEFRRNPPAGDKVTEATVAAYIKGDEELTALKEEILQKEYERNISRDTSLSSSRPVSRTKKEKTSDELERLRSEWRSAKEALQVEEANVKFLEEKMGAYALLIAAYWVKGQQ